MQMKAIKSKWILFVIIAIKLDCEWKKIISNLLSIFTQWMFYWQLLSDTSRKAIKGKSMKILTKRTWVSFGNVTQYSNFFIKVLFVCCMWWKTVERGTVCHIQYSSKFRRSSTFLLVVITATFQLSSRTFSTCFQLYLTINHVLNDNNKKFQWNLKVSFWKLITHLHQTFLLYFIFTSGEEHLDNLVHIRTIRRHVCKQNQHLQGYLSME